LKLLARTQWFWDRPSMRALIEQVTRPLMRRIAATARIPRDMVLPKLAGTHLPERYPELVRTGRNGQANVAYFHGCAAKYFDDGVGDAVIRVLRQQGIEPALPPQRCSGTPIQTYGHVDLVKEGARFNIASFEPYETIVTGCASCTLMLKDYPKLFSGESEEEAAKRLAKKVKHVTEMGSHSTAPSKSEIATVRPCKVTYHSSCHLRAAGVTKAPRQAISQLPGVEFVEMQDADRCAGGAGTYMLKDYDTSQKIFDRKRRAIEESGADIVATSCPACMIQLNNGLRGKVAVKHVAELMSDAYEIRAESGEGMPSHS
jgi:Fe-S oxidoreductase